MERWKVKLGRRGVGEAVSCQEIVAEQVIYGLVILNGAREVKAHCQPQ